MLSHVHSHVHSQSQTCLKRDYQKSAVEISHKWYPLSEVVSKPEPDPWNTHPKIHPKLLDQSVLPTNVVYWNIITHNSFSRRLSRIRLVHSSHFASDIWPFQFSPKLAFCVWSTLKFLLPFEELVRESKMWLNDHIQTSSSNVAICTWKREAHGSHHFGDADGCWPWNTNSAMNQRCRVVCSTTICSC